MRRVQRQRERLARRDSEPQCERLKVGLVQGVKQPRTLAHALVSHTPIFRTPGNRAAQRSVIQCLEKSGDTLSAPDDIPRSVQEGTGGNVQRRDVAFVHGEKRAKGRSREEQGEKDGADKEMEDDNEESREEEDDEYEDTEEEKEERSNDFIDDEAIEVSPEEAQAKDNAVVVEVVGPEYYEEGNVTESSSTDSGSDDEGSEYVPTDSDTDDDDIYSLAE